MSPSMIRHRTRAKLIRRCHDLSDVMAAIEVASRLVGEQLETTESAIVAMIERDRRHDRFEEQDPWPKFRSMIRSIGASAPKRPAPSLTKWPFQMRNEERFI